MEKLSEQGPFLGKADRNLVIISVLENHHGIETGPQSFLSNPLECGLERFSVLADLP